MHRVKHQGQQPIKHRDLWEEAYLLKKTHEIRFELIPANSSDKDHNRCISMANAAIARAPQDVTPD